MNRLYYFILSFLLLTACGKEDTPSPSGETVNYFKVPESATDAESILRREFEQATGCYVLFNDTLYRKPVGTDADGVPVYDTETVDLSYGVLTSNKNKYSFTYLPSLEAKKQTIQFVKDRILPVLEKQLYPYSFLLVDSVYQTTFYVEEGSSHGIFGSRSFERFYVGTRCFAFSGGDLSGLSEDEQSDIVKEMIKEMIRSKLRLSPKELESFYGYGKNLYEQVIPAYELYDYGIEDIWDLNDIRQLGFLAGYVEDDYDYGDYVAYCPSQNDDLDTFIDACLGDEENFLSENADYPIVLQKYRILKEIIQGKGFHTEKL